MLFYHFDILIHVPVYLLGPIYLLVWNQSPQECEDKRLRD